ncbi:MAG TPA: cysteine--tRNA ligase [Natronincola sp.]|nr:cysteine--tRNA ligase [Natronincola sp.]
MNKIKVYNTLTQKKEEFIPRKEGEVSIYVCGVTPYSDAHLGHARPSVVWDVIRKYFRSRGYKVTLVQNFTDVDDKIIVRSQETGIPALDISGKYIEEYLRDMDELGVERADFYPKVSEHITEIVELVETLVEKDHAYSANGDVFFHVASFPEYGKLSKQKLDELRQGTRFEVDPNKRDATDFALWKSAKEGEPAWESPWGQGRPGWHIECSAMSLKYLGEGFDFHGGGNDLIFPHHENEIAQSEAATGEPLASYWVHNGMVNLKDTKMSKSIGNVITVGRLIEKHSKELLRFYLLSTHYRTELEYYDGKIEEVSKGWKRLNDAVSNLQESLSNADSGELSEKDLAVLDVLHDFEQEMEVAFSDDFNTARVLGILFEMVREINVYKHNRGTHEKVLQKACDLFQLYGSDILGIIQLEKANQDGLVDSLLDLVVELREDLRKDKNFGLADKIRYRLADLGITLEDTPQGTRWKV